MPTPPDPWGLPKGSQLQAEGFAPQQLPEGLAQPRGASGKGRLRSAPAPRDTVTCSQCALGLAARASPGSSLRMQRLRPLPRPAE